MPQSADGSDLPRLGPVDLLVHLPIGVLTSAHRLIPEFVMAGREQTRKARQLGVMVLAFGRLRVDRERRARAAAAGERTGPQTSPRDPGGAPPSVAAITTVPTPPGTTRRRTTKPATLPIDGYDVLPAADIVPLLAGLSPAERRAIAAHETAGRGRRTILARIEQLDVSPRSGGAGRA